MFLPFRGVTGSTKLHFHWRDPYSSSEFTSDCTVSCVYGSMEQFIKVQLQLIQLFTHSYQSYGLQVHYYQI